jgi:pimeloyl-ACP methyl ester carboxylesterase
MNYPIVSTKTSDGLELFGYFNRSNGTTCLINIHGSGASFYVEGYEPCFIDELSSINCSCLFTNNRGSYLMESWQKSGAAVELFEDSVKDIDAWIEYAQEHGSTKIILQGHSFGTEKVVYYMTHGKHTDAVAGVTLLGFADSVGTEHQTLGSSFDLLLHEAKTKIANGKGYEFLTSNWNANSNEMPMAADTFVNFYSENSALSTALPLRNGKELTFYKSISVPILAVIGDQKEYTVIPIDDALALLESENARTTAKKIIGADHTFTKYRSELVKIVSDWIVGNMLV